MSQVARRRGDIGLRVAHVARARRPVDRRNRGAFKLLHQRPRLAQLPRPIEGGMVFDGRKEPQLAHSQPGCWVWRKIVTKSAAASSLAM